MNVRNTIENLTQILSSQQASSTTISKQGTASGSPQGNALESNALGGDQAQFSQLGAIASHAAQSSDSSDVRMDKVASIQSALQAGTYQVPAADVARKLVNTLIGSELGAGSELSPAVSSDSESEPVSAPDADSSAR